MHGFRFIQLPFNLYLDQAMMIKNQTVNEQSVSILDASKFFELGVFTSVPFMQGRLLAPGVMPEFNELDPSLRALQFIRSTPGVIAPLIGQKTNEHVKQNLEIMKIPSISEHDYHNLVKKLTSGTKS
jgi:predicted aldo/keto reductase-like oxidoreductase